jgi:predicted signal transduction protein with EAL and GGDEF domain
MIAVSDRKQDCRSVHHVDRSFGAQSVDLGRQYERESAAYKSLNNIVGRLGGEEFAILLEGSNLKAAVELAEHLRTRISALAFDTGQGKLMLTCSFGVSEWKQGENFDQLLKRADSALYDAKTGGRSRVVAARRPAARTDAAHVSGVQGSVGRSTTADQDQAPAAPPPDDRQWLAQTA